MTQQQQVGRPRGFHGGRCLSAFPGVRAASSRLLLVSDLCPSCLPLPACLRSRGVARPPVIYLRHWLGWVGLGWVGSHSHRRLLLLSTGQCNSAPASPTVTDTVALLSDVTLQGPVGGVAFAYGAVKEKYNLNHYSNS
jgi:hypothetical protein